ncbi:hypothetical protein XENOCAPTIV_023099, partial [Xenoophorus captivus]
PNVDEHSVMTYLSQFPKAKLKPGAPLRPKLNPKKARAYGPGYGHPVTVLFAGQHISKSPFEVDIGMAQGDSSKATAQGPGLEPAGNIANKATYFDVYTAGSI